jgi:predicted PurR-regulated permease PerM/GAF domain-containing protein
VNRPATTDDRAHPHSGVQRMNTTRAQEAEAGAPAHSSLVALPGGQRFVITGAVLALGIVALYYGRSLLMPLAFAALLAFVLDPVVAWLRRWHVPRAAAVSLVIVVTLALLGGVAGLVAQQVVMVGQDLPTYRNTIHKKVLDLRPEPGERHVVAEASRAIEMVEGEIDAARKALDPKKAAQARSPTKVVVQTEPPPPLQALASTLEPVVVPLVATGLVIVLLAFMLMQRRELRDRIVRLTGGDLHHMADAMNESAQRVSRYLGTQLLVNIGYGLPMALGLWWIGVPGAWLWGFLAAVLRFVPYLGPAVAAVFPLILAFAVDPGWSMVAWTVGLIVTLELITNSIVEPLAYGRGTGVSPVAVLLSAGFWTLVWGPVGLVLATPLTVCLVVIGRHLGPLRFLNVLLGSEPVFDQPTQLYQRLISGDLEEAIELCHDAVERDSLRQFYSATAVPMLALAAHPAARGATAAHRHRVVSGVERVLEDLREDHDPLPPADKKATVLCLGARNELDTLSAEMLAHALRDAGVAAHAVPALAVTAQRIGALDVDGVGTVVLCTFNSAPQTHTRYVCRRLRRRAPQLRIVLAAWSAPAELRAPGAARDLGADALAVSLIEAVDHNMLIDAAPQPARTSPAVTPSTPPPSLPDGLARGAQKAVEVFAVALATVTLRTTPHTCTQAGAGLPAWGHPSQDVTLDEASPLGHVLANGEMLVVQDVEREPRFAGKQDPRFEGLHFIAAAPILAGDGAVLGVLALHDAHSRRFGDDDRKLLASLAASLSPSLQGERSDEQPSGLDELVPGLNRA